MSRGSEVSRPGVSLQSNVGLRMGTAPGGSTLYSIAIGFAYPIPIGDRGIRLSSDPKLISYSKARQVYKVKLRPQYKGYLPMQNEEKMES